MTARDRRLRDLRGTLEHRGFDAQLEVRKAGSGNKIVGYASVFDTSYEAGGFREQIKRGAFRTTLAGKPDVVLLINHEGLPLARTRSGTLTLSEDSKGLRVEAQLEPGDPDVRALLPKLRRGDLTEMSFAFRATDDWWNEDRSARVIRAADIHRGDVSIVTHGANTVTSVSLRSPRSRKAPRAAKVKSTPSSARKPLRVTHSSYIERAKAKRARYMRYGLHGDRRALTDRRRDRSQEEVDRLGEQGLAHKALDGSGYHFPAVDEVDLVNAIKAVNRARAGERWSIRKFLIARAKVLGLSALIPSHWTASGALEGQPHPTKGTMMPPKERQ